MTDYKLVNPVIIGTFENKFKATSSDVAARTFWEKLTESGKYISGNVPLFLFTLMETKNKKLHHFKVQELPTGKYADYSIESVDIKMTKTQKDKFIAGVNDIENSSDKIVGGSANLSGGKRRKHKHKDDDSSSSSSSSDDDDLFRYLRLKSTPSPISYWWYAPTIYSFEKIYTPTFVAPLAPYSQLWFPVLY